MPYNRPTLTELRRRVDSQIKSNLKTGSLLRFSNLGITGDVQAGLSHLHYGYLDYIAQQSNPFTATGENLEAWAALKQVYRKPSTAAGGYAIASGAIGSIIPAGTILNRPDGYSYLTESEVKISGDDNAIIKINAILPDPIDDTTGGGLESNTVAGTILTLDRPIIGLDSQVITEDITGGANIETDDSLRSRMLLAYQNVSNGGSELDYKRWALDVPGVTRVWVKGRGYGANTIVIYIMCDGDDKTNSGFPIGSDGVSKYEEWPEKKATGDQARVADALHFLKPVTPLIYVVSPIAHSIDFKISGISTAPESVIGGIKAAINTVFFDVDLAGRVPISQIVSGIANVPGTDGFVLQEPSTNIFLGTGELPLLGKVKLT